MRNYELDEAIVHVGEFGKFQKRIYYLICIPAMYCAMTNLIMVFTAGIPRHRCRLECESQNSNYEGEHVWHGVPHPDQYAECEKFILVNSSDSREGRCTYDNSSTEECHEWIFEDTIYESTIVTQFELVCERRSLQPLSRSLYMAGHLVGALIMGWVSDKWGRKMCFMICVLLTTIPGSVAAFPPSFVWFMVMRVLSAIGNVGLFQTCFVIGLELVGPSKRMFCGISIEFFFAGGGALLGGIAYLIRDWKTLQLVVHVPGLIFLAYYWFVPESPRWEMVNGKGESARRTVRKMAATNGKEIPEHLLPPDSVQGTAEEGEAPPSESLLAFLKKPRLRIQFINICFNWFANVMVYYGLSLNSTSLGGSAHLNFALSMLVEIPAYVLCLLVLNRWGRKFPLAGFEILGGIACLVSGFLPTDPVWLQVTLSLIGKLGLAASFAIIYVFTGELYPTVVRNAGIGSSSMCGRIGGILAPIVTDLGTVQRSLPMLIFGGVAVLAGISVLHLPETLGANLPETIEQAEDFSRAAGFFKGCRSSKSTVLEADSRAQLQARF